MKCPAVELPDMSYISALAIPSPIRRFSLDTTVFCFNTPSSNCFSWAFIYQSKPSAIVIATSSFYPSLFIEFLTAVSDSFADSGGQSDPLCRFGFVQSLLLSWSSPNAKSLIVTYPLASFTIDLAVLRVANTSFGLAPVLPHVEEIWRSLITGESILIIGSTPGIATATALAALSLLGPLPYKDLILLYTEQADPRFHELCRYKLVATTDEDFVKLPFRTVIYANQASSEPVGNVLAEYGAKSCRYYGTLLGLMDFKLMTNPYFDILELPINVREFLTAPDVDPELLSEIQHTATFRKWRLKKSARDQSRAAFLSVTPDDAIEMMSPTQYRKAFGHVRTVAKLYQADRHLVSVLRIHMRILKRKFKLGLDRQPP
jgi:hypothetical protein